MKFKTIPAVRFITHGISSQIHLQTNMNDNDLLCMSKYVRLTLPMYTGKSSCSGPFLGLATRVERLVPLVKQNLLTLWEYMNSSPVFTGFVLLNLALSVGCL